MKNLKKLLSLALILAISVSSFMLASCHGKGKKLEEFNVETVTFDYDSPVEITFWAKNDNNQNQRDIYNKAIADFQKLYPNITVKVKFYSNYGDIYNDVITNIQTNSTPNVCITYPDHIATYLTGTNIVVPLDELMADSRYGLGGSEIRFDGVKKGEIIDQFLKEGQIAGKQYALPFMRSTEACYVNKDYVEALGYTLPETLTWDFIWEVSEAAMAKNSDGTFKVNGQNVMIPFIYKSTDNMMIQMLAQKNAGYSTDNAEIGLFNNTTKELLYEVAEHAGTRAFSTFKISSYPGNYFNAGQCIFAIDSTAGATWIGSDAPLVDIDKSNLVDFETVVMTVPQFDTANPKMISQGPSVCIFNNEDPQKVIASWFFVQYLLTNGVQIDYAQTEGYVPVTSKAQQSAEYQDYLSRAGEDNNKYYDIKIAASKLLIDNVQYTFTTPVFSGSASLRDAAGQLIEEVTKAKRRGQTVDSAFIEKLYNDMWALFNLDMVKAVK